MQDRSIPTKVLLTETFRLLPQFLLLVAALALVYVIVYFTLGSSELLALVVAAFFAVIFFAAPLASSSIRAKWGLGLLTRPGRKTLLFCFAWGCIVVAGFMATLQLWQGMGANPLNYVIAMASAGLVCAATAAILGSR